MYVDLMAAADFFGLPREEVPLYVEAMNDIGRQGVDVFAANLARETDPKRREVRQIVLTEVRDHIARVLLEHYEGPMQ